MAPSGKRASIETCLDPLICVDLGSRVEHIHGGKRHCNIGRCIGGAVVILATRQERGRAKVDEGGELPPVGLQLLPGGQRGVE